MSDLINRQAAIDALEEQLDYLQMLNKDDNPTAESKWYGINWARNTIADLPSAQPEKVCIANITLSEEQLREAVEKAKNEILQVLPSVEPEWNNHTVACLLAEMFGDDCACNFNNIDDWLPEKCEVIDSCPHPVGVACWEQFLKHRAERRTNEH